MSFSTGIRRVVDERKLVRALHTAFGDFRVRAKREFFKIDPFKVRAILEILALEDITPRNELVAAKEDLQALRVASIKSGRLKFSTVGIPIGATLNFVKNTNITTMVVEGSWINYEGEKHSLRTAALEALVKCEYK